MSTSKYHIYDKQIIEKYQAGDSSIKIAKDINSNPNTVVYRLKINGIKIRTISEALRLYSKTKEHKETISRVKIEKGVAKGFRNPNWKVHSKGANSRLGELLGNPTVKSGIISSRVLSEAIKWPNRRKGSETMHPTRRS